VLVFQRRQKTGKEDKMRDEKTQPVGHMKWLADKIEAQSESNCRGFDDDSL
jgi:hypothetical protein